MAEDAGAPGQPGYTTHAPTTAVADAPGPGPGPGPGGRAAGARPGDGAAFWALFDRWFDSCVDVAWQVLHDADAAAGVAQDAFFAAWHARTAKAPAAEAGAWALRASRDGALGRLAQARHQSPGAEPWPSSGAPAVASDRDRDAGADLVRATFAALGEADASVLDLHLRHGFTVAELGQALGVPRHDAQELVLRLNRRLGRALRAWALWPASRPGGTGGCAELRAAFEAAGVRTFGPEAVAETARHTKSCARCQDRQRLADTAEALYAAAPVVPAGTLLAEATANALADRGVPPRDAGSPTSAAGGGAAVAPPAAGLPAGSPAGAAPSDSPPTVPGMLVASPAVAGASAAPWATAGPSGAPPAATPPSASAVPPPAPAPPSPPPVPIAGSGAWAGASPAGAPVPTAADHPPGPTAAGTGTEPAPGGPEARGAHFSGRAAPSAGHRSGRKSLVVALAIVAALALSAGAAFALSGGDGDGEGEGEAATSTTNGPPATEAPPTTAPATSTTTASTTTSAAPAPTTTAGPGAPTTAATPTTAPAGPATTVAGAPPEVADFSVASVTLGRPCAADQRRITLSWSVARADSVRLSGVGAPAGALPATGRGTACRASGPPVTYTLTASGPGGTQTATLQA